MLGTPVVNAATHTIYLVAETLENQTSSTFPCGTYVHRLHAFAQRGMTLIEILVVLTLIGIVMGIIGGNFIGKGEKAKAEDPKALRARSRIRSASWKNSGQRR